MIISNLGVSQSSAQQSGAMGLIEKVGNFHMVHPNISNQEGKWLIRINSTQPYTLKVLGKRNAPVSPAHMGIDKLQR